MTLVIVGTIRFAPATVEVPPQAARTPEYKPERDGCIDCHEGPRESHKAKDPNTGFSTLDFLSMTESKTWKESDLHSKAFEALDSKLGKDISNRLYQADDACKSKAECLACHAIDKSLRTKSGLKGKTKEDFETAYGVGCQACHGYGSLWEEPHRSGVPKWRETSPAVKKDMGQNDLRDPQVRAAKCADCHVGNVVEGKFVTHKMYAAGHPPLPPLEVASFSRDQKMHFEYARKLEYFKDLVKKDRENNTNHAWTRFHYRGDDVESQPARQAAVGAIVTFRSAMRLLADSAGKAKAGGQSLDFAHFNCYACHHDLESRSRRQEQGYAGIPGRPQVRTGLGQIARAVAEHAATAKGGAGNHGELAQNFDRGFGGLIKAIDGQPFGNASAVESAANQLETWCAAALKVMDDVRYDRAATERLLGSLAAFSLSADKQKRAALDYDTAQQLLWMAEVLRDDIKADDASVAQELKLLGESFARKVRAESGNEKLLVEQLPDRFRRASLYDPNTFRSAFGRIANVFSDASEKRP